MLASLNSSSGPLPGVLGRSALMSSFICCPSDQSGGPLHGALGLSSSINLPIVSAPVSAQSLLRHARQHLLAHLRELIGEARPKHPPATFLGQLIGGDNDLRAERQAHAGATENFLDCD